MTSLRGQFCLTWWTIALCREHPYAEAFAVLGSACDVGTVTAFSHQWLVSFTDSFPSPTLTGLLFPVMISARMSLWVEQGSLFHQGLNSPWSFPRCCTGSGWFEWVSAAQLFKLLPALVTVSLISVWYLLQPLLSLVR